MKFQKGLLSDRVPDQPATPAAVEPPTVVVWDEAPPVKAQASAATQVFVEKERLFETLEKETSNARKYLTVFGVVVLLVIAIGAAIAYLTLPGVGDRVRVPAEVEIAVRDHFLIKEKRTATDIIFYQCEGYYGARVGVETRTDIPNPLFRIDTYSTRVAAREGQWDTAAAPSSPPTEFAVRK